MRFKLTFESKHPSKNKQQVLPINYQYPVSSWIYKMIHSGNSEFAEWLHSKGYMDQNKQFRLFNFSNLQIHKARAKGDRLMIGSPEISLIISFYPIEMLEYFITGLFKNQHFSIGDKKSQADFIVKTVERLPEPAINEEMEFQTLSPVLVSYKKDASMKYADYLHPENGYYAELLVRNLVAKYNTFYGKKAKIQKSVQEAERRVSDDNKITDPWLIHAEAEGINDNENTRSGLPNSNDRQAATGEHALSIEKMAYHFELLSEPKSKLITIKSGTAEESQLRGYLYKFRLSAPVNLMRMGYYAGFGEKNSLGFGCGEVVEK